MNEDRKRILDLLAAGKITADEAERLISALGGDGSQGSSDGRSGRKPPKYLRVLVDADGHYEGGAAKVNIRVPMQLLRAGVRLTALIPAAARDQVDAALREQGVPFNVSQIKPENLEAIIEHLDDLTVDVDADSAKVRVFCQSKSDDAARPRLS